MKTRLRRVFLFAHLMRVPHVAARNTPSITVMKNLQTRQNLALAEWSQHFQSDFDFLQKIPSSAVRSTVTVLRKFPESYDFDFVQRRIENRASDDEKHQFHLLCSEERCRNLDCMPWKEKQERVDLWLSSPLADEQREVLQRWKTQEGHHKTPNAKEIRKAFFPKLRQKLDAKEVSQGGGGYFFPLHVDGGTGSLEFDFGGARTMNYWIDLPPKGGDNACGRFVSYESFFWTGDTNWDLMSTTSLDRDADFFLLLLDRLLSLLGKD